MSFTFGWHYRPEAIAAFQMATSRPFLSSYMGDLLAKGLPDKVYLWDAGRKVTGNLLPERDQGQVGSCVGFGFALAVDILACVEIAAGDAEEYKPAAPEAIYALSRVEIGGGQIPASEDGSTGSWAAQALMRYGVLARGKYGDIDLSAYDEALTRRLGGKGLPPELETIAKEHPVKSVALVRTAAEVRAALANGYPVAVCSTVGFNESRDSLGRVTPGPTWPHCMTITGYDGQYYFIDNSWDSKYYRGPNGPGDPPNSGAYVASSVVDRMVMQGDSYALSRFDGFPAAKVLDWIY
jgi:hypothetical protein